MNLPGRTPAPAPRRAPGALSPFDFDEDEDTYPEALTPLVPEDVTAHVAALMQGTVPRPLPSLYIVQEMEQGPDGLMRTVCHWGDDVEPILCGGDPCEPYEGGDPSDPYDPEPDGGGRGDRSDLDDPDFGGPALPDIPALPGRIDLLRSEGAAQRMPRLLPEVPALPGRLDLLRTRLEVLQRARQHLQGAAGVRHG